MEMNLSLKNSNNKIKTSRLIYFNNITNIFFSVLISIPILIDNFKNSCWIILLLLTLLITLLSLFFKGFSNSHNTIKYVNNNLILKILITTYILFAITIINLFSCLVIKKFFYTENGIFLIGLLNILIALYLSKSSFKKLINTGMIFFFIIVLSYIIPFFTTKSRYFEFLFPLNIELSNLSISIIILLFPLENIFMVLLSNQTNNGIKQKHLIISNIITLLILLIITIDTITLLSPNYLQNLKYSSFYRWNFLNSNTIFQNYDILIFLILVISVIFRLSYYIKILKVSIPIKQCFKNNIILLIIFLVLFYLLSLKINQIFEILDKALYFMFFFIFLIFSIFSFKSMEGNNDKNRNNDV